MAKGAKGYEVREFLLEDNTSPVGQWLKELPVPTRARVAARIARFEAGNLGDAKAVGDGVWEARFMFGPGYRLYFGVHQGRIILLLTGGDKGSQRRDIERAKRYWRDFLEADDD
ncbi:MAG TPA: type II toxin-antitoxin system RelE/ParE family toxin [Oculatellaceae cyanobacterium]